ncbi:hypothetical protein EIP91_005588 [Steccherinum ochraceum]|uniref:Uncharacterized protein n=1 Tax=Steccherinum ochraceum TaxID=92696 RepID=A0A4R0R9M6_9APHY|nr:hypothetical protein EIP91_005588 [Steccherinum ochraceum]
MGSLSGATSMVVHSPITHDNAPLYPVNLLLPSRHSFHGSKLRSVRATLPPTMLNSLIRSTRLPSAPNLPKGSPKCEFVLAYEPSEQGKVPQRSLRVTAEIAGWDHDDVFVIARLLSAPGLNLVHFDTITLRLFTSTAPRYASDEDLPVDLGQLSVLCPTASLAVVVAKWTAMDKALSRFVTSSSSALSSKSTRIIAPVLPQLPFPIPGTNPTDACVVPILKILLPALSQRAVAEPCVDGNCCFHVRAKRLRNGDTAEERPPLFALSEALLDGPLPPTADATADTMASHVEAIAHYQDMISRHHARMRELREHSNRFTAINARLPFELLSTIFILLVRAETADIRDSSWPKAMRCADLYRWLKYTHVCRHWRQVMEAIPAVWSSIVVNLGRRRPGLEDFSTLLSRSGQLPLHVYVIADRGSRRGFHRLAAVLAESHRFIELSYSTDGDELCGVDLEHLRQQIARSTVPILRRLTIINSRIFDGLIDFTFPSLEELRCYNIPLNVYNSICAPLLTRLVLDTWAGKLTTDKILKIIARFPSIRYLELSNAWQGRPMYDSMPGPSFLNLPYLEDLVLTSENWNCKWGRLLHRLGLPETARISFTGNAEFKDIDEVASAFGQKMDLVGPTREPGSIGPFSALWMSTSESRMSHQLWTNDALEQRENFIPPQFSFHAEPAEESSSCFVEDVSYPRAAAVKVIFYDRSVEAQDLLGVAADLKLVETACVRNNDHLPGQLTVLEKDDHIVEGSSFSVFPALRTLLVFGYGDLSQPHAEYWNDMVKTLVKRKQSGQPISKLVLVHSDSTSNFPPEALASLKDVVDIVMECTDEESPRNYGNGRTISELILSQIKYSIDETWMTFVFEFGSSTSDVPLDGPFPPTADATAGTIARHIDAIAHHQDILTRHHTRIRELKEHSNGLSIVNSRLPFEVLSIIFTILVRAETMDPWNDLWPRRPSFSELSRWIKYTLSVADGGELLRPALGSGPTFLSICKAIGLAWRNSAPCSPDLVKSLSTFTL